MAGTFTKQGVLPLGWQEDYDSRMHVDAVIGTLPASTTVAAGTAGIVEYVNGGPRFRMDDAVVAAPKGQFPAVAMEPGSAGDRIRVMVYGQADATFITAMDSTTNKVVKVKAGGLETAVAATVDNERWGLVIGAGATGKTHTVFLDGQAMHA